MKEKDIKSKEEFLNSLKNDVIDNEASLESYRKLVGNNNECK